jgi:hypothetical protein
VSSLPSSNITMSTPLPAFDTSTSRASAISRRETRIPGWLREPLLHFVLLGGLLFAVDQYMVGRTDDPRTIVVGPEVDREAVQVFQSSRGRAPNDKELRALHQIWLDNEVLYREGLAMEVDRGDDAIRDRVIFKALSVIDANVRLPAIDDKQLREWFESHREKYDEPARFNFQEAALAGEATEVAVRSFVEALNAGTPGDARAGLRVFKDRPRATLIQSYGAEFPKELEESPPGIWRAMNTRDGWRAMRLDSTIAPKPAVYEILRGVVMQDWKDAIASEQRTAAVRALAKKYKVKFDRAAQAPKRSAEG